MSFGGKQSLPARARSSGGRAAKPARPPHEILSSVSGATGVPGRRLPTAHGSEKHSRPPSLSRGEEILGGLADLPVAILERPVQRGVDLAGTGMSGIEERRQGEHGSAADRWPVGGRREDRVEPRSSPIAPRAATHDSRTSGSAAAAVASSTSRSNTSSSTCVTLAARPGRNLDDHRVGVGEGVRAGRRRGGGRRSSRRGGGRRGRHRSAPPRRRRRQRHRAVRGRRGRRRAHRDRPPASPARAVAASPWCPARETLRRVGSISRSILQQVRHRRDDHGDGERAHRGDDGADEEDEARRSTAGRRDAAPGSGRGTPGVGSRTTWIGTWRGVVAVPRDVFGVALAVLRQPVSTRAMIASPAMIAARMVRSLTDTQPQTLVTPLPLPAAADVDPAACAGPTGAAVGGRSHSPPSRCSRSWRSSSRRCCPLEPRRQQGGRTRRRDGQRGHAVRRRPGVGAGRRRPGVLRRPRRRRGCRHRSRWTSVLRHGLRTGAVGARLVGRRERAGDPLPHERGEVRFADAVAAAHDRPADDAHVESGRPVRRPHAGRLRARADPRAGADRAAAVPRHRRATLCRVRPERRATRRGRHDRRRRRRRHRDHRRSHGGPRRTTSRATPSPSPSTASTPARSTSRSS